MNRKEILSTIITDFQSKPIPEIWERDLSVPINSGKIITLSGVRRSGKTYHLFKIIKELLEKKVAIERIVYINFEDERLNISSSELGEIVETYQELYPNQDVSRVYFFFDEIQEISGWEKFVVRLYNNITKNIYVTGSNAKMLSREIATSLRGRTVTYEVYPLSFKEYVNIKDNNLKIRTSLGRARALSYFKKFLKNGGFPETVSQKSDLHHRILQEYFSTMVLRDIIERYDISSPKLLKDFCKRIVGSSGGELSINKIYNEFKTLGYKVGKDTIYQYLDYAESVYLTRLVTRHTHSVVKSEMSQKKSYVIDSGIGSALDYKLSRDMGKLFETTIALELLKANLDIAYYKNSYECDFVIRKDGQVKQIIQASYNLSDEETIKREVRGIVAAAKANKLTEGYILTLNDSQEMQVEGINIIAMPAWKYLLS